MKSQTTILTTLDLGDWSTTRALPQLPSILLSNPLLQELVVCGVSPDVVNGDRSVPRIPLRHSKKLYLSSDFRYASPLLNQLELPGKMDGLDLSLRECPPPNLSQTLGPYLEGRVRCRSGFPDGGLGLLITCYSSVSCICTGDKHKLGDSPYFTLGGAACQDVRPDASKPR